MDADIAVRLANEGVPVRAIARAVREPSEAVRLRLVSARASGDLIDLPVEDWPAGYPREQRLLELARLWAASKPVLQEAARRVFRLSPAQVPILLLLLTHREVARHHLPQPLCNAQCILARLRPRLKPFGLRIVSLRGTGYYMPAAHRRKAMDLILEKPREVAPVGLALWMHEIAG